jgi:spore maturation protein CgeB
MDGCGAGMKLVLFCHSLVSDWNHGNAHFLRGICSELSERGHQVRVYEPRNGWSRRNLARELRGDPEAWFARAFPDLRSEAYDLDRLDLDRALDGADLVLVHEWNEPELVARLGARRAAGGEFRLLFHDSHHRAASAPEQIAEFDLRGYDGMLAFGDAIRRIYLDRGWVERAWAWHEAADVRVFRPFEGESEDDVVWIGNWGDGERTRELREFLLSPARRERLSGSVYGVRYPWRGRLQVRRAGLRYRGWIANHLVPQVFARHRLTVHIPRRPYTRILPGVPTVRMFEALACGIPLICSRWEDEEGLFREGQDYLSARDRDEMRALMREILHDPQLAASLRRAGLESIRTRHTCAHRVDELLAIHDELAGEPIAGVTE